MAVLHNRVSQKELKQKLNEEPFKRITLSFYRYLPICEPQQFRDEIYKILQSMDIFGRIYIAGEGINAQASVPEHNFEDFKQYLLHLPGFQNLRINMALDDDGKSFWVLKIKVREKIVADGIRDPVFNMDKKGRYVDAIRFNELTADPDTVVVDMRNHYEYEVGHFQGAIEIPSETFREQLPMAVSMLEDQKEKNIIMYCTGGIRCEKASAWMLHNGFRNVFHLEGGIINYANTVRERGIENKFKGKNFVFDDRLGERVGEEVISQCHQCGQPSDIHINCANDGCHLLFIQCQNCSEKFDGCCSTECLETLQLPDERREELRKGRKNGVMVFNKSRARMQGLSGMGK